MAVGLDPNGFDPERRTEEMGEGEPVPEVFDLDGRRAYRGDPEFVDLQVHDVVVEVGDAAVVVVGDVDPAVIESIARVTTIVDGTPVTDPGGLPEGWVKTGVTVLGDVGAGLIEPESGKYVWYGQSYERMRSGTESGPTMVQVVSGWTPAEKPLDEGEGGGHADDPDPSDGEGLSGVVGSGSRPGLHWEASVRDRILEIEMLGLESGVEARIEGADIGEFAPIAVTAAGDRRVIGGYVRAGQDVAVQLDGADATFEWGMERADGSRFWFVDASGVETMTFALLDAEGSELAAREMVWSEATPMD